MELYLSLYGWFPPSPSVHRVLCHGAQFIREFCNPYQIPVGFLSEEAGESNNRRIKFYRTHHTRKVNRQSTMQDWIERANVISDPLLGSFQTKQMKADRSLPQEVKNLLTCHQL